MKTTKKQLRALISELVMENLDASLEDYAELDMIEPNEPNDSIAKKDAPAPPPPPLSKKDALMNLGTELGRTDIGDKAMEGDIKGEIKSLTKDPAVVAALTAIHPLAPLAVKSTLAIASLYDQYAAGQMRLIDMIMAAGLTDAHDLYKELSKDILGANKREVSKILAKRNSLGTINVLDDEYKLVIHLLAKEGKLGFFDRRKRYDLDSWLEKAGMKDEASFLRQQLGYSAYFSGEQFDMDQLTDKFKDKEARQRELERAFRESEESSDINAILRRAHPALSAFYRLNKELLSRDIASSSLNETINNQNLSRGSLYRKHYYGRY